MYCPFFCKLCTRCMNVNKDVVSAYRYIHTVISLFLSWKYFQTACVIRKFGRKIQKKNRRWTVVEAQRLHHRKYSPYIPNVGDDIILYLADVRLSDECTGLLRCGTRGCLLGQGVRVHSTGPLCLRERSGEVGGKGA